MTTTDLRHRVIGLVAVVVIAVGAVAGVGYYTGAFSGRVEVTVLADRSGLLLDEGSDVAMRRVDIGTVLGVETENPEEVRIRVGLDREHVGEVPADVTARVVSSTLLAPKYVDLEMPQDTGAAAIEAGAVIVPTAVQTEVNVAFENLMAVLDHVDPAQLNSALGALSTTLQSRGAPLGDYLQQANRYFETLEPSLPGLQRDITAAADVSGTYADVAPDLLRTLDSVRTTGNTVVEKQAALDTFFASLTRFSDDSRGVLERNEQPLVQALDVLRPTTALAERYAPIFPCLFATVNQFRRSVEPASGGTYPGLYTSTTPLPGQQGYDNRTDLPKVAADDATCSGGPIDPADGLYPRVAFDDGSPPLDTRHAPVEPGSRPLAVMLFGEAAAERMPR